MRSMRIVFPVILILCLLPARLSQPTGATAIRRANTVWLFVEVETKVTRKGVETDSEHPEERRWYMSNVVVQPEDVPDYSLVKQKIIPYFEHNLVEPAAAKGIVIDYYDQNVRVNGETSRANYETRQEAEESRNKAIEDRKGDGNIYSFELVFGPAKGEETSKPKLIDRDKGQPNYEAAKATKPGL